MVKKTKTIFIRIDFSLVSKRAKRIVKRITISHPIEIKLSIFVDGFEIYLESKHFPGHTWMVVFGNVEEIDVIKRKGSMLQQMLIGPQVEFYLIFPLDLKYFQFLIQHISDIFQVPIREVNIEKPTFKLVELICSLQKSIPIFAIFGKSKILNKTAKLIFKRMQITESCYLKSEFSNFFKFDQLINCRCLKLSNGSRVPLNAILSSKNEILRIENSRLTHSDFNSILKHWKCGKMPNLNYLEIGMSQQHWLIDDYDDLNEQMFANLDFEEHQPDPRRPTHLWFDDDIILEMPVDHAYDIIGDDGSIGTFRLTLYREGDDHFRGLTFEFHVWGGANK
ncbi:hypothetical protein B9Z55_012292 [Caenorhabditis nigoni]|uniref:Sdz-33 F-box domain-containing protein n=1 Tax=Caenorhabditis nigoni TaxID=1611254 RepID=A0A2G5TWP4_9PELO|nr:hypothetical protein B9Z55_012292 [Caenorhabditis nigoni]